MSVLPCAVVNTRSSLRPALISATSVPAGDERMHARRRQKRGGVHALATRGSPECRELSGVTNSVGYRLADRVDLLRIEQYLGVAPVDLWRTASSASIGGARPPRSNPVETMRFE